MKTLATLPDYYGNHTIWLFNNLGTQSITIRVTKDKLTPSHVNVYACHESARAIITNKEYVLTSEMVLRLLPVLETLKSESVFSGIQNEAIRSIREEFKEQYLS